MRLYGALTELASLVIRLASGKTVKIEASEQTAAGETIVTIPDVLDGADEMVMKDTAQTLTNKTLTAPVMTSAAINSASTIVLPATASPAQTAAGSMVWDSDDLLLTVGKGSGVPKVIVDTDSSQTLSQKTISGGTIASASITNPTMSGVAINSASRIYLGSLTTGVGNSHVLISDANGDLDSEAALAKIRGGAGADMTNVTFPATGVLVTEAGSQTLSNKTIGSVTAESGLLTVSGTGALRLPLGNATTNRPTGTAAQLKGMIRYNDTDDAFEGYNELSGWSSLGGGGTTDRVTQASHAFVIGDILYMNGSVYAKAKADAANTAEVVGMVSRVIDANTFELTLSGEVAGLSGLTVGENYFLSAATAGAITATEPSVVGQVSLPIGVASSATSLYVAPKRGAVVGGANVQTQIGLNGAALVSQTTNIQNVTAYTAGELTGWVYIDATIDRRFYIKAQFVKDAANAWKVAYQTTGDTPPAGFNVDVIISGPDAFVQVQMPPVAGWVSGSINFALNAPAVGATLPLQISGGLVTGPVLGSTSGVAPAAGYVGEVISGLNSGTYTNYGTSGAIADISGATVTLSAGTWILYSEITGLYGKGTADIIHLGYVRKSDNTMIDSWWLHRNESVAGSFGLTTSRITIVTISSSTTYKLSMATTATVTSYASQGASIRAVRIA
jgi:hypothetical protein